VQPGASAGIRERDPRETLGLNKADAEDLLRALHRQIGVFHQRLYAENTRSLLLVLQGLDASGKDGVIRSVFTGANPQGCRVVSFKAPTSTELAHDYLWRIHVQLPARGEIGIFNRSHYEDIVAVRMLSLAAEEVWRRRAAHIRDWERMLTDEGTTIVKVFLNVSKAEQGERLQGRIDDPEKRWKFRRKDLEIRKQFDDYIGAYEETLTETSTEWAPWHVVPADRNWVKAVAVAHLLVDALELADPKLPSAEPGVESLKVE
jgi:PPK2 family polyphosphate:nucleotide phosphotransferase